MLLPWKESYLPFKKTTPSPSNPAELCEQRISSLQEAVNHQRGNKSKRRVKQRKAHSAGLDPTQVTCLLPPPTEVSMCFTQRRTPLSLPQELSTITIPITAGPPETAVFITDLLLCAADKVSVYRARAQRWGLDEVWRVLYSQASTALPHPLWSWGALYMSEQEVNACWEWVYKGI